MPAYLISCAPSESEVTIQIVLPGRVLSSASNLTSTRYSRVSYATWLVMGIIEKSLHALVSHLDFIDLGQILQIIFQQLDEQSILS